MSDNNTPINTFGTTQQADAGPTGIKLTDIFVGTSGLSFQVVGTREETIAKWKAGRTGKPQDEYLTFAAMDRGGKAWDLTVLYYDLTVIGGEHDYVGPVSEPLVVKVDDPKQMEEIMRTLGVVTTSAKSEL